MNKPRFAHDCNECVYLGFFMGEDLYYCPQGGLPTVIARFSSVGQDYRSGMCNAIVDPSLREAKERAIKLGLEVVSSKRA